MRVTSIQLEIKDRSKEETLRHVLTLLDQARGSELILLPELWPCGYYSLSRYEAESEPIDGPTVERLREKARELQAYLFMGSFVERSGQHLYNTSLLLDSSGEVKASYRKIHLFRSEEGQLLTPGEEIVTSSTPWGTVGLSICYDLRFPELYRRLLDQGAEMFLVSAAWPAVRREAWILFNRTRALENLAFLCSCNAAGINRDIQNGGHSMIVDPFGKVLAEADDGEALISAELDLNMVRQARKDFPRSG